MHIINCEHYLGLFLHKKIMKTTTVIILVLLMSISLYSQNYLVKVDKSEITWTGKKVAGQHTGNISISEGSFVLKDGLIVSGEFIVDMNSITCTDIEDEGANQSLINHLKSADFFDSEKYPYAKFVIKNSKKKDNNFYEANGSITIKDISKPYNFRFTYRVDDKNFMALSNIIINRADFNVKYNSSSFFKNLGDKVIYDNFDLHIKLVAIKE